MQVTLTWQTIVTLGSVAGAFVLLVTYFAKLVKWVEHQKEQDMEIQFLKMEQGLMLRGILAALKGLQEQGCNGPVTETIHEIEQFLLDQVSKTKISE